ncbi:Microtubule organization protein AKNA [Dissostichus eleginoides]|uniref:Microtubule organization protein AKNA n=1 Tax=Dissostichus eleginoides TaxID=100907 RepID=A0AAD9F0R8_DISEL|nr:Microtubule organization protein AKNA [Dissostichus eleginoides]
MERINNTKAGVICWTPAPAPSSPTSSVIYEEDWDGEDEEQTEKNDDFDSQMDENGIIGLSEALEDAELVDSDADYNSNSRGALTPEEEDPSGHERETPEELSNNLSEHLSHTESTEEDKTLSSYEDLIESFKAQKLAEKVGTEEPGKECVSEISQPASPLTAPSFPHLLHFTPEEMAAAQGIDTETFPDNSAAESLPESHRSHLSLKSSPRCPETQDKSDKQPSPSPRKLRQPSPEATYPQTRSLGTAKSLKFKQKTASPGRESRIPRPRSNAAEVDESRKGPLGYRIPDFSNVEPRVFFPKDGYVPPKSRRCFKRESLSPGPPFVFKSPADIVKEVLLNSHDTSPASSDSYKPISSALNSSVPQDFRSRLQASDLLDQLQEDYYRLLTKHAEAENTIDRLRLEAKVNLFSDPPKPGHLVQSGPNQGSSKIMVLEFPRAQRAEISSASLHPNGQQRSPSACSSTERPDPQVGQQLASILYYQADKFFQQMQTFEDLLKSKRLKPLDQKKGVSQLAEGLDSLERGYLLARDDCKLLQQRGAENSFFDHDRELEGLVFQCGLHMDELKELSPAGPVLVDPGEAAVVETCSTRLGTAEESLPKLRGALQTYRPQSEGRSSPFCCLKERRAAWERGGGETVSRKPGNISSTRLHHHTPRSSSLQPLHHHTPRSSSLQPLHHHTPHSSSPQRLHHHTPRSSSPQRLYHHTSRSSSPQRPITTPPAHPPCSPSITTSPTHRPRSASITTPPAHLPRSASITTPPAHPLRSPSITTPPAHRPRSPCNTTPSAHRPRSPSITTPPAHRPRSPSITTPPAHPPRSRRTLEVGESPSSSLSSLGEITALERRNSKLLSGIRRVLSQDGIISPETDSGFVCSESSRLTPAAAASPVHQRASESVSVPQERIPQMVPVSAPSPVRPLLLNQPAMEPNRTRSRRNRMEQRRRILSCSPQRCVPLTGQTRADSGTSEFGPESDSSLTVSEHRFTQSINSSPSFSLASALGHHDDPLRALSSSQAANRNDAIQMLQVEVRRMRESLDSCLRNKNPVRAAPSAHHNTSTPIRPGERRSDVRERTNTRPVDEDEEFTLRRTTRKRTPSSNRPKTDICKPQVQSPPHLSLWCPGVLKHPLQLQTATAHTRILSAAEHSPCVKQQTFLTAEGGLLFVLSVCHMVPEGDLKCQLGVTESSLTPLAVVSVLSVDAMHPTAARSQPPPHTQPANQPTHPHPSPAEQNELAVLLCCSACQCAHPPSCRLYSSSPLYVSPSNSQGRSSGVRGRREVKRRRRRRSLSVDKQRCVDSSLERAIRAARSMRHTSGHMARALKSGLHFQRLLAQDCSL